jgi:hypothetical protein
MLRIPRDRTRTTSYRSPDLPGRDRGDAGSDRLAGPPGIRYERTQPGYLMIAAIGGTAVILLLVLILQGPSLVPVCVLGIMIFILAIMSRLTVSVTADTLRIRFGPVGLVRKEWRLSDVVAAAPVTNPWYYGYGLRWTPHGPLFNVSGRHAVEILLVSGDRVRIGTDDPEALADAINRAVR